MLQTQLTNLLQGALIADALVLPAHWLYDPAVIKERFGRLTALQAPPPDGYHAGEPLGGQTHYGAQTLVLMDSLGARGAFDGEAFANAWQSFWAASPQYRDGATKATLAAMAAGSPVLEAGSGSADLGGAVRIAPLLVAMAAAPESDVIAAARTQTAMTHRHPAVSDAAAFFVRAVRGVLAGLAVPEALAKAAAADYEVLAVASHLAAAKAAIAQGAEAAVHALGAACAVEGAFPATLALALAHDGDLAATLIDNAMAGGDSAARGLALGMLLGAQAGTMIPERWLEQWRARPRVEAFLAATRPA